MQSDSLKFLKDCNIGNLIASRDWESTELGRVAHWSDHLRSTLGLVLPSPTPILLFWGKTGITFFNDAYWRAHGLALQAETYLGQPARSSCASAWPLLESIFNSLWGGGPGVELNGEDLSGFPALPRQKKPGIFSFSSILDAGGHVAGILAVVNGRDERSSTAGELADSKDQLAFAIDAAELGTWDLNPLTGVFSGNARLKNWFGLSEDAEMRLETALNVIDPADRTRVSAAMERALTFTSGGRYHIDYTIVHPHNGRRRQVLAKGRAWFGANHLPYRFNGTLQDVTDTKRSERALQEAEIRFRHVSNTSPTGLWLSDENGRLTYLNTTLIKWTGLPYASLLGDGWAQAILEVDRPAAVAAFAAAIDARAHYEAKFRICKSDGTTIWCQAEGDPIYDELGNYVGFSGYCSDINELVLARAEGEKNALKFATLMAQAPVASCLFTGPHHVIEMANEKMLQLWGKPASVIGLPLIEALPELKGQPFIGILDNIFNTGENFSGQGVPADIVVNGHLQTFYFDFTYKPLRDENGRVYGIMDMAVDVTEQVLNKKELEEAELFARSVISNSPVAKIVFIGEEMVLKTVNQTMLDLLQKDSSIIGKTYYEVFPELLHTHFPETMLRVLRTGETYAQAEERIDLMKNGKLEPGYYSYIYKALRNTEGVIYGIIVTASDITQQVMARKQVEETELRLSNALELAELSTWSIHVATRKVTYSPRLQGWLGIKESVLGNDNTRIDKKDRERVMQSVNAALLGKGTFDEVYAIVNSSTGKKRTIHALGQLSYDEDGKPYELVGVAQDVTLQKELQIELESQVQIRTEQLAAINEELAATNEELSELNRSLTNSNAELEQYAYVASHDLQEPLRKIQIFSDLLHKEPHLSAESRAYLQKITRSAERMSLLIKDLLEFSRLLNSGVGSKHSTDLNRVISDVVTDFELLIAEKNAHIVIENLPVIDGVRLQMNQLFSNLLNNALKFVQPGQPPQVRIHSSILDKETTSAYIHRPQAGKTYYRISVTDNGIGVDPTYKEQIFDVFKRLHNRESYAGSGIGLALCRRIVHNHGGHIYVDSAPGKGSSFHLILPG